MSSDAPQDPRPPDPRGRPLSRKHVFTLAGVALLLLLWQIAALTTHNIAVASPADTTRALWRMIGTREFQANFLISLARMIASIVAGGLVGFALGIVAGLCEDVHNLLEPLRWTAMSVPPVTVLVLAMLWLGLGTTMVVFMTSFLLAPIIYINTVKGMELVDRHLLEMAHLYRFPLGMRIRHVYVPALAAPLMAGMVQVVCSGVRVVILAEVMGAGEGIGAAVAAAGANLQIPTLFAWVLLSVGLVAVFEYLLLRPIQRRMLRWRNP